MVDKLDPSKVTANAKELTLCSMWEFLRYFLWLGTFGFGGPIALAGYMQRDLVERNRWVSKEDAYNRKTARKRTTDKWKNYMQSLIRDIKKLKRYKRGWFWLIIIP